MTPGTSRTLPRLIIIDDHRMVAEALRQSLSPAYEIVGVGHSGAELFALLGRVCADCILLDCEMPGSNGYDILPRILREHPGVRILMVTMIADAALAHAALTIGAHGFIPKDAPIAELRTAIDDVLAKRTHVSNRIQKSTRRLGRGVRHPGLHRLTPRQEQIVLLLGDGRCPADIGRALHLSPSTITFHKHNIMRLLGVHSEAALLRYAVLLRSGTPADAPRTPPGISLHPQV
jgi:DNA-binding NarL/FixJ family response regulator